MFLFWHIEVDFARILRYVLDRAHEVVMSTTQSAAEEAIKFGKLIRARRKALGMRQEDVVFASGVGRRYLIDLEAGKATSWIGPALLIAKLLGIEFSVSPDRVSDEGDDLPDLEEEHEASEDREAEPKQ